MVFICNRIGEANRKMQIIAPVSFNLQKLFYLIKNKKNIKDIGDSPAYHKTNY